MKEKKGFTLIELLAVIVILAIIALIATPIVLSLIEKARKGAAEDSAYGIRKEAQLLYQTTLMDRAGTFDRIEADFSKKMTVNGKEYVETKFYATASSEGTTDKAIFEVDGTVPTNGKVTIHGNGQIEYEVLTINSYYCCIPAQGNVACEKTNSFDANCKYTGSGSSTTPSGGDTPTPTPGGDDTPSGGDDDTPTTTVDPLPAIPDPTLNYTDSERRAVRVGGYNWHVIRDDGENVTLLLDLEQNPALANMELCKDEWTTNPGIDCYRDVYGTEDYQFNHQYKWNQTNVREYLNSTFLPTLIENEPALADHLVTTKVCTDVTPLVKHVDNPDYAGSFEYATMRFSGYTEEEINELNKKELMSTNPATCSEYVNDSIRLLTTTEYYNFVNDNFTGNAEGYEYIPHLDGFVTKTSSDDSWFLPESEREEYYWFLLTPTDPFVSDSNVSFDKTTRTWTCHDENFDCSSYDLYNAVSTKIWNDGYVYGESAAQIGIPADVRPVIVLKK